jgi:hypothetical protein
VGQGSPASVVVSVVGGLFVLPDPGLFEPVLLLEPVLFEPAFPVLFEPVLFVLFVLFVFPVLFVLSFRL